jgi:hypothetical protein
MQTRLIDCQLSSLRRCVATRMTPNQNADDVAFSHAREHRERHENIGWSLVSEPSKDKKLENEKSRRDRTPGGIRPRRLTHQRAVQLCWFALRIVIRQQLTHRASVPICIHRTFPCLNLSRETCIARPICLFSVFIFPPVNGAGSVARSTFHRGAASAG